MNILWVSLYLCSNPVPTPQHTTQPDKLRTGEFLRFGGRINDPSSHAVKVETNSTLPALSHVKQSTKRQIHWDYPFPGLPSSCSQISILNSQTTLIVSILANLPMQRNHTHQFCCKQILVHLLEGRVGCVPTYCGKAFQAYT